MKTYRELFEEQRQLGSDKWAHYFELYDRHLGPYRHTENLIHLEIGVQNGGSLAIARKFFHPSAKIFGIDIDPRCKALESSGVADGIFIGPQADRAFLEAVLDRIGGPVDTVVDDGSHVQQDMIQSFLILFPFVKASGCYIIEDTHTAFFHSHQASETGLNVYDYFKAMADKITLDFMVPEWRGTRFRLPYEQRSGTIDLGNRMARSILGIHFYNSMIVIERRDYKEPLRVLSRP